MMIAPDRSERKGYTLVQAVRKFGNDKKRWRWLDGVRCPECDSLRVSERKNRKLMPFRCRACSKDFSVKSGVYHQMSRKHLFC